MQRRWRYSARATSAVAAAGSWVVALALAGLGAPWALWLIALAIGLGLWITAGLWWYWGHIQPAEGPEPQTDPPLKARLVSELKDGHLLDARLPTSTRRDAQWHELCKEIDVWVFEIQQLLYLGPTEFLTDFDGDWKPNPLQSRDAISTGLQARLRELSEIVKKLPDGQ